MSSQTRHHASHLRVAFARANDLPLDDVETRELPDGDVEVFCSARPELPVWSTGAEARGGITNTRVRKLTLDGWENDGG